MKTDFMSAAAILICASVFGQTAAEEYREDVESIDAIITAYYEVVSGSGQDAWQFERDKYIHSDDAVITKLDENGRWWIDSWASQMESAENTLVTDFMINK